MKRRFFTLAVLAVLGAAAAFAATPSHSATPGSGTTTTAGPGKGQATCTFAANATGTTISVVCSKGISDYTVGTCATPIDFSGHGQPTGALEVDNFSGGNDATITDDGRVITQLYLKAADTRFVFNTAASCSPGTTTGHTTTGHTTTGHTTTEHTTTEHTTTEHTTTTGHTTTDHVTTTTHH